MGPLSGHNLGSRWEGLLRHLLDVGLFSLLHITLAGKVKPLLRNGHRQWMLNPLASPDGKWLAYQAMTWDSNVWLLEDF